MAEWKPRHFHFLFTVMVSASNNLKQIFSDSVNKSVILVYSSAPQTGQITFQRLRLTNAEIAVPLNILYQLVYSL